MPVGRLIGRRWLGESVVAWRGEDGKVCVADAYSRGGLGFLFVETTTLALGARTLNWFLATPVDGDNVDILVSAKVQALDGGGIKGFNLVPKRLREKIMLPLVMYEFKKNIENDFMVWENKVYRPYPLLIESDGEILKFRRCCTQFYPESENGSASTSLA